MDEKFSVVQFSVFSKKSQGDCREETQETQGESALALRAFGVTRKVFSGSVFSERSQGRLGKGMKVPNNG
jgi:hypothetical protein